MTGPHRGAGPDRLHVLRVFLGPDDRGGNPLGVFLDGGAAGPERRQAVAAELGFSETVWVRAREGATATVAIHTPATELRFAGHPTVGTAWLLAETGAPVTALRCPAGLVATWQEAGRRWIRARPSWVHAIDVARLGSVAAVDAVEPPAPGSPGRYVWAWEDEPAGRLRARYFPTDLGIVEDEATGAAAVLLGGRLGRPLVIRQGVGSQLVTRPGPDGTVEVGGRCAFVEERAHPA